MIRTPFDQFAKELLIDRLSLLGRAVAEHAISAETQRADIAWTPDPHRIGHHPPRDVLDRMARVMALWEFFHCSPRLDEFIACVRELFAWHGLLRNAARAAKKRPPSLPPPLWILSSGHPRSVTNAYAFKPMRGWPRGFYAESPAGRVRLVVLNRLPRTHATLLLRLMGAGVTLKRAVHDLRALSEDAPERVVALPHFERLRESVTGLPSLRNEEFPMNREQFLKETEFLHQQFVAMTRQEGFERGIERGAAQGLALVHHQFSRKLARPLTSAESRAITERLSSLGPDRLGDIALDLDAAALAAWLADPHAR